MSVSQLRTPRTKAIAYRIWAYAEPRGWDCTVADASSALNISCSIIIAVCRHADWLNRLRSSHESGIEYRSSTNSTIGESRRIAGEFRASIAELDE